MLNKKHASIILTCAGAAGVVLTSYLTAKATIKAVNILDREDEDLSTKEKILAVGPTYIPPIISGVSTIVCIFGANILNQKYQASLMSAYALMNSSYNDYQRKLKELYGEETHQNIMDALAVEKAEDVQIYHECLMGSCNSTIGMGEQEKVLFYDDFSKRYFESTVEQVMAAEYHLNRNYILRGYACLNEFYTFLGLDEIDGGDVIGWTPDSELYWVDFDHRKTELEDGLECCIIYMCYTPTAEYLEEYI